MMPPAALKIPEKVHVPALVIDEVRLGLLGRVAQAD